MNGYFCQANYCIRNIEKDELTIFITGPDWDYTSRLTQKKTLEKIFNIENLLFINEEDFNLLKNVVPNKEYYTLID